MGWFCGTACAKSVCIAHDCAQAPAQQLIRIMLLASHPHYSTSQSTVPLHTVTIRLLCIIRLRSWRARVMAVEIASCSLDQEVSFAPLFIHNRLIVLGRVSLSRQERAPFRYLNTYIETYRNSSVFLLTLTPSFSLHLLLLIEVNLFPSSLPFERS